MSAAELNQAFALAQAGRVPEAAMLLTRLAGSGNAGAMTMLGEMKWNGMVTQDPPGARALFERAADAGNATARIYATNLLGSGVAGRRDWTAALAQAPNSVTELIGRMTLDAAGNPAHLPEARRLSDQPDILFYERLFTAGECDYLRAKAEPIFQPSTVYDATRKLVRDPIRTSDGATLAWLIEDPVVHALNRRLAAACGTQPEQGEAIQILRYRPGQQYRAHLDFLRAAPNQRILTALVWLNHDYQGGETAFLKTGLKVKGRKGDAMIFRNALPDGNADPLTEHAGMPVTKGTKYLASRWIRESRWAP